jgi:hypothetical protein
MEDEAKIEQKLNKLNEILKSDESFKKNFLEIFDTKEKVCLQIIEDPGEKYTTSSGCHCFPYLCGSGCFALYKKGAVVG